MNSKNIMRKEEMDLKYEKAVMQVIILAVEDVIITSFTGEEEGDSSENITWPGSMNTGV